MSRPLDEVKAYQRRERQKRKAGRTAADSVPFVHHTPGPWNMLTPQQLHAASGSLLALISWKGFIRHKAEEEIEANARLIAAAPDLLAACRLMYRAWEELLPNLAKGVVQDYHLVLTEAPCACKAAIAKATRPSHPEGETP